MKKILTCLLSICICMNGFILINADETKVTYTPAQEEYVFSIPADLALSSSSATDLTCTVSKLILTDGNSLEIKISSKNGYKLKDSGSLYEAEYAAKKGGATLSDESVAFSFEAGASELSQTIQLSLKSLPKIMKLVELSDVLTFTAEIVENS